MRPCLALVMILFSLTSGELRIRDYFGDVEVTRVVLDSLRSPRTYQIDVDGDGRKDTVRLYFEQVGYHLVCLDGEDKVWIAFYEAGEADGTVEFAAAYVTGPRKPVMVVKATRGLALGDSLFIVDLVRTAGGLRAETLLTCGATWADATTIVEPRFVECRHFRGWPEARYSWNGERFVAQDITR